MTVVARGIRNAFRNTTRAVAVMLILGLAIGLSFVMLIAHRSVTDKVATTLSSVGNTVTIGPPGYSAGGRLGSPSRPPSSRPSRTSTGSRASTRTSMARRGPATCRRTARRALARRRSPEGLPDAIARGGAPAPSSGGSTSLEYPGSMAFATAGPRLRAETLHSADQLLHDVLLRIDPADEPGEHRRVDARAS